ncbi:MAG TPA: FtsX-like permease family protein [Puia sp.]|nr:FtsX-like permease family protein [Puia sp.]
MFFNYLKTGIRNLLKYKVFSFINVFGLAAAMSVGMLIILMLADEKSHDQFNVKKDRIYRILCHRPDFRHPYATSPFPLATVLGKGYPIIERATHLVMGVGGDARYGQQNVTMTGYFADTAFFEVFSYGLERGDRNTALTQPNSMVITHAMARRLFGDEEPVGKVVAFSDRGLTVFGGNSASKAVPWGIFRITGVIDDHPYRSHLKFDVLVSAASLPALSQDSLIPDRTGNWSDLFNCFTYVVLEPGKTREELNTDLAQVAVRKYAGLKDFDHFQLSAQPLTRISPGILLGNEPTIALPMMAYYFLSFLALVVLVSACLNYINLSLARALKRSREIGVRKVAGARKPDLVVQFLGESVLTALLAMGMALGILLLLRTAFLHLWVNQYLNFDLSVDAGVCAAFLALALLTGIVAGVYPAFYLSRFEPILALKSTEGTRPGKLSLRKALSVAQFVLSLFFIITAILIYNQFRFFLHFKYEFQTADILNVDLQGSDYKMVSREFGSVPGVTGISACDYLPATTHSEGFQWRPANPLRKADSDFSNAIVLHTDEHFIPNLGLKLVAGQEVPAMSPSAWRYVVVNETAARSFGYDRPAAILGAAFETPYSDSPLVVVGVVQDFHMRMLLGNDKIEPLVLQDQSASFHYLNVRIGSRDVRSVMTALARRWRTIDPVHAFSYSFFDEELASESQGIFDVVSILGYIAFLVVIIACLGMLGMATYTTERRRKEVGIRKVLGAGDWSNTLLLSREFVQVLLIAIGIAAPLSYLLNEAWLRKFPNRVDFGWGTVLEGVTIVLALGVVTIASQTVRASRANPVEALRCD